MTKSKNTIRALWASILSMLVCAAMLVGSTLAWFSDSITSGKNKIVAGNLDVELEYSTDGTTWNKVDADTDLFKPADETLWEPGHTEYVYLRVSNVGSLALKYQFAVNVYGDENGGAEKEYTSVLTDETGNNKKFKLSNYLVFSQTAGTAAVASREDLWIQDTAAEKAAMGKLDGLGKAAVLLPNASETMTLAVYMPTQVGNEANQLTSAKEDEGEPTIFLGLTLNATQTPHEEDSFDNTYDENAFNSTPTTKPVNPTGDTVLKTLDEKVEVTVPHDAVAEGVDKLTLTVTPTDVPELNNFDAAAQNAVAYNVKVDTLKENNEVSLTAKMFAGLGRKNAKLYCNNAIVGTASYDESTGFISYTATSFSADDIYTIVWDKELFTVTYKTNADQVIGNVQYEVGKENAFPQNLSDITGWESFKNSLVGVSDVYSGGYFTDKSFSTSAVMPEGEADGEYIVYAKLTHNTIFGIGESLTVASTNYTDWQSTHLINPYTSTNEEITISNYAADDETKLAYILCGAQTTGTAGTGTPYTTIVLEYQEEGQEGWVEYPLPYSSNYMQYISPANDNGTWRIKDVVTTITNDSGETMYEDHTDNVPKCEIHLTVESNYGY